MNASQQRWEAKLKPYVPTRLYSTGLWHFAYSCGVISTHYYSEHECRMAAYKARQSEEDMVESIRVSVKAAFENLTNRPTRDEG